MDIESNLEKFIVDELLVGSRGMKLDYDQSLISSGVIDSLALLRLITFIEEKFGVTVGDEDVVPDNFETINITQKMVTLVMVMPDAEAAVRLEEGLKKIPYLSEMELDPWSTTPLTGTNLQRITFTFKRMER